MGGGSGRAARHSGYAADQDERCACEMCSCALHLQAARVEMARRRHCILIFALLAGFGWICCCFSQLSWPPLPRRKLCYSTPAQSCTASTHAEPGCCSSAGAILVNASAGGLFVMPYAPIYAAAKAGCVHLVSSLKVPLARRGIRICAVCPQPVDTPLVRSCLVPIMHADDCPL